jgi:predicted RNA binding protein YcfA (HicA-like mRNA interferase family)
MAKLPIVSGAEAVKALQQLGFFVDRQRGSHAVLKKVTPQGERGFPQFSACPLRYAPVSG